MKKIFLIFAIFAITYANDTATTSFIGNLIVDNSLSIAPSNTILFYNTDSLISEHEIMRLSHISYNHPSLDSATIHVCRQPVVKKVQDGWEISFKKDRRIKIKETAKHVYNSGSIK